MNRVVQRANQVDSVLSADGRRPERLGARYRRGQTRSRSRSARASGGAVQKMNDHQLRAFFHPRSGEHVAGGNSRGARKRIRRPLREGAVFFAEVPRG